MEPEVEAEDDLTEAVPLGRGLGAHRVEPIALDELGDDHPLSAEGADHPRHVDERVPFVQPRHRALVRRLELVVELIDDALADLARHRLRVELGRQRAGQTEQHPEVLHVGSHGIGDPRILGLDGDLAAVSKGGPIDLADRCRGNRLGVEVGERRVDGLLQVGLDHPSHRVERERRRRVAERRQLRLEPFPVLRRDHSEVNEREDLAELHRRALHPPEDGDDLLRGLELTALEGDCGAFIGATDVCRTGARLFGRLLRDRHAHPGESPKPPGRQPVGLVHYWPLNSGSRFCMKATTPSTKSVVSAISCCRSASR